MRFQRYYSIDEWSGIYSLPLKACVQVRTRIVQYKINVNCLMTNSRLCKMRTISNDKCSFCETHPEIMRHMFYDCTSVKTFWTNAENWWEKYFMLPSNWIINLSFLALMYITLGYCWKIYVLFWRRKPSIIVGSKTRNRI